MIFQSTIDKLMYKIGYISKEYSDRILSAAYSTSSGIAPDKSYSQLVDAYKSWVYTAIDKIAKSIASLPVKLYVYRNQRGEKIHNTSWITNELRNIDTADERKYFLKQYNLKKEQIFSHPYLDLINRPNNIMTRFMLWYETSTRMELSGLCAWYMPKNKLGLPGELWPLPLTKTATIKPVVSGDLILQYWIYTDGEVTRHFKPDEIVAIKYPNPASPFKWYSPLEAQTYPYDIDLFLMQQQRALFQNKGIPGLTLKTDKDLPKKRVDEIKEQINEQFVGATKAGGTLLLHSGFGLEKTGWSPQQAMIDEVARYAREKILSAYDISEGKVGLVRDVNRANMEALDDTFIKECIKPKTMLIEEVQEQWILPLYDQGLTLDFDLPDVEDSELKLRERQQNLTTFFTTINEEREKIGMAPVEWGDKPWMTFNLVQPGEGIGSVPQQEQEAAYQETHNLMSQKSFNDWPEEYKAMLWQSKDKNRQVWENIMARSMAKYFKQQGKEVIARLQKHGPQIQSQYSGWAKKAILQHIAKKGIGDDINISKDDEAERLKMIFEPIDQEAMKDSAIRFYAEIGITFDYNVNDQRAVKWLGARMDMFSKEVSGTTFDEIKAILREGYSEGQPISTITETLRNKFASYEKYRAPLIARTESAAAMNKAELLASQQAGVEDRIRKHWLSARDNAVRDTHVEAERRYAKKGLNINEDFVVGADTMDAPGNGSLPEENINCRCDMAYSKV